MNASPGAFIQALIVLSLCLATGTIDHLFRVNPLPWRQKWSESVVVAAREAGIHTIALDRAMEIVKKQSHVILDARPHADFLAGHIPGAFSVPSQEVDRYITDVLPLLTPEQPIMTYCSGHQCDESVALSRHLLQNGFTNVLLFVGGWSDWHDAGQAVEK